MIHKIDETSLLWGASPEALEDQEGLEFVALLDGIDETTSTVMQARHAYTAKDIRWGQSFAGVLSRGASGALRADYSDFDATREERSGGGRDVYSSANTLSSSSSSFINRTVPHPHPPSSLRGGSSSVGQPSIDDDLESGVGVGGTGGEGTSEINAVGGEVHEQQPPPTTTIPPPTTVPSPFESARREAPRRPTSPVALLKSFARRQQQK